MQPISEHCARLEECNQRGGRMLSMFDLILDDTLDADLAAWLMAEVSQGHSFLIGARPGGAGKTTVMCALANMVPADTILVAATEAAIAQGLCDAGESRERRCYLCHEIGLGSYYCYLWGDRLRDFLALSERGGQLAANLHADYPETAREQICDMNRVPEAHFQAFRLLVFLRVRSLGLRTRRWIDAIHVHDDAGAFRLVYSRRGGVRDYATVGDPDRLEQCRRFFAEIPEADAERTVDAFRRRCLEAPWYRSAPALL